MPSTTKFRRQHARQAAMIEIAEHGLLIAVNPKNGLLEYHLPWYDGSAACGADATQEPRMTPTRALNRLTAERVCRDCRSKYERHDGGAQVAEHIRRLIAWAATYRPATR
jgi:hypothetical protein